MFHSEFFGRYVIVLLIGFASGLIMATVGTVMADGDSTTDDVPRMIPYQGILEINGEPVNGPVRIEFSLFDGPYGVDGVPNTDDDNTPVYTQPIDVEVYRGRFTASIGGADTGIEEVIRNADDLYLGMTLLGPEGEETPMSGRQRILATPYAMWTTSATNFNVANNLVVAGDMTVSNINAHGNISSNGSLTASNASIDADISIGRDIITVRDIRASRDIFADDDVVVSDDLVVNGSLVSNTDNDVTVDDNLIVNGSLSITNLANCRICIRDEWRNTNHCVAVNGGWSSGTNGGGDNSTSSGGHPKKVRMDCGPSWPRL